MDIAALSCKVAPTLTCCQDTQTTPFVVTRRDDPVLPAAISLGRRLMLCDTRDCRANGESLRRGVHVQ